MTLSIFSIYRVKDSGNSHGQVSRFSAALASRSLTAPQPPHRHRRSDSVKLSAVCSDSTA